MVGILTHYSKIYLSGIPSSPGDMSQRIVPATCPLPLTRTSYLDPDHCLRRSPEKSLHFSPSPSPSPFSIAFSTAAIGIGGERLLVLDVHSRYEQLSFLLQGGRDIVLPCGSGPKTALYRTRHDKIMRFTAFLQPLPCITAQNDRWQDAITHTLHLH